MWLTRRDCGCIALLLAATLPAAGAGMIPNAPAAPQADPPQPAVTIDPQKTDLLALRGFDPVSYFLPDGPAAGLPRFELTWRGRVWRFASAGNREAFRRDPEVYAPRLGGYDAAGLVEGRLVDADPLVFALIGERLYLFRNAERRGRLLAEPGLAQRAEALWPSLGRLTDGAPE